MAAAISSAAKKGNEMPSKQIAPYEDKQWLRQKYVDEGLSTREIAERTTVTNPAISYWLDKHGIDARPEGRHRSVQTTVRTHAHNGHEQVQMRTVGGSNVRVSIHRIAAVAWFGYDAVVGKDVHHRNGIPWDNREENLALWTHEEHMQHHAQERLANGDQPSQKLTAEDAREIRERYAAEDVTHAELAEDYPVTQPRITRIINGDAWGDV